MAQKNLAQEYPRPGEHARTQDLLQRLKAKLVKANPDGQRVRRAKMHGVVKAEFIVHAALPEHLRVGVFKQAASYQAWIRFSNLDGHHPDIANDIRGMAIKLMGVPGEKLLELEKDAQTQDFVLSSSKVFVARDVEEFAVLAKVLSGNKLSKLWFFMTHWRVVKNLYRSLKQFANPLQIRYFSTTPYLLGKHAVKYSALPHLHVLDAIPEHPDDNFLREAMIRQLEDGEALFDFAVQLQTNADSMPIEDAGKEWKETAAPFYTVATIKILQQSFDSAKQRNFGKNLSFSPWHSLPEHRPLGGVNRARKLAYIARQPKNALPACEPNSFEI